MRHWPNLLEDAEVAWVRQQLGGAVAKRGMYRALTENLNVLRAMKGKPLIRKNAVFCAAIGYTFKHVPGPMAPTNHHYRSRKLTRKHVREIVKLLDQKDPVIPTDEIARQYGVSQVCVSKINTRSIHQWATKGQSRLRRSRNQAVTLGKEDLLCLLRCATDREWWHFDVLAEIFGLPSANAVKHRLRAAQRRHRRLQEQRRGSMIPVNTHSRAQEVP